MTPEVHAWLLDLGYGHRTAVAPRHMAEYVFDPALHAVPLAQAHLRGVTRWRGLLVPLVDLAVLLGEPRIEVERRRAVILAYRTAEDAPIRFGGLIVRAEPKEIPVRDDMACPLPSEPEAWREIALSCFSHEEQPVPILNIAALFPETRAATEPALSAPLAVGSSAPAEPQPPADNHLQEAAGL